MSSPPKSVTVRQFPAIFLRLSGAGRRIQISSDAVTPVHSSTGLSSGCNTAGDALEGLNGWCYWLCEQAAKRAKANGRKTVRAHDFIVM